MIRVYCLESLNGVIPCGTPGQHLAVRFQNGYTEFPVRVGDSPTPDVTGVRLLEAVLSQDRFRVVVEFDPEDEEVFRAVYDGTAVSDRVQVVVPEEVLTRSAAGELKPFVCELCGARFENAQGLAGHTRSHRRRHE